LLDRLAASHLQAISLARLRALLRGLDEADATQQLLLCIGVDGAARDRIVDSVSARKLPGLYFAQSLEGAAPAPGYWNSLRELAARGISIELRGRVEWEQGKAQAEHIFAGILRAKGELERRMERGVTLYRLASGRPRPGFRELLARVGFELCAGRPDSGADLEVHPLRELLSLKARAGAQSDTRSSR
jgi:hypothetical protein